MLKILRQIHFLKKVFRGLNSSNLKDEEDSLDTLEYDDLSEFDSNEFDHFEDEYDDDEEEEGSYDDEGDDEFSHFNSMETDYESCFDDEDGEMMEVSASHFFPRIRRTVRSSIMNESSQS